LGIAIYAVGEKKNIQEEAGVDLRSNPQHEADGIKYRS
jgi:hypothetical protein